MTFNPQPKPTPKAKKPGAMRSKPKTMKGATVQAAIAQNDTAAKSTRTQQEAFSAISAPKAGTKGDMIQAMLKTPGGATSKELEAATGWQPHSVRGYLGTLRKAKVNVISKKLPGEPTIYRIEAAAPDTEVL